MTRDRHAEWRDMDADDLAAIEILQSRPNQSCPAPELIQASGAGTLSPQLEARVAAHVAHCAACRALAAALDDPTVVDLTSDERGRILERVRSRIDVDKRASRRRTWAWAAAAVALAAAGSLLVWQSRRPSPRSVFELDKPELLSLDLPAPNETATQSRERPALEQALAPFRSNDYALAAQLLASFVQRYPRNATGHFFLGVSELFLGRDATAVRALESAEQLVPGTDTPFARQTSWYLALAYVRTGRPWNARVRLEALCNGRAEFTRRACDGLQTLPATYRLSGVVTSEAGEPLDGATVGEYLSRLDGGQMVAYRTPFSARTDAAGRYSVSGVPESPRPRTNLRAAKPGYFTAPGGVAISSEMRADFRLTPWTRVALDDVVKGTLEPGVASCAGGPEPCRQFAVSVPRSGTLDVSLATAVRDGMDFWVETPTGDVYSPPMEAPLRLSVRVFAGAVCQITVVSNVNEPRQFELTMRLR